MGQTKEAELWAQFEEIKIEKEAFFSLSYGLYLLCARSGGKDNGCIINTVMQVTDRSPRILFTVENTRYTAEMLHVGDAISISVIDESAPFELYRHFGYQSGRDVDKFAGRHDPRDIRGIRYLGEHCVCMIGAVVEAAIPCGTHTVFFAAVKEAKRISDARPVTYSEYFERIKPKGAQQKPSSKEQTEAGYVCRVCGYVYHGEELPDDFVCPVCHRGADVFERLQS